MDYKIIRSGRKTVALCVLRDAEVIVRVPWQMPVKEIEVFVGQHRSWLEKKQAAMRERKAYPEMENLHPGQIKELRQQAQAVLPQKVEKYAQIMGVQPKGIKITSAAKRWGSCSSRNSLCFPYRLMLLPDELIDYIVVHELAHLKIKNHSKSFYDFLAAYLPDYRAREARLKQI